MHEVVWTESALEELATLWLEADSVLREAIAAAQSQADRRLESNPSEAGESRPGDRRIAFFPPLGVVFSISESRRQVKVLRVWKIPGQLT
jgi:hypothetical protein